MALLDLAGMLLILAMQDSSYGEFGYNVYFNNTLLGFTTNTSYTINNPSNPYGTYKVVATFQKYDGLNSDAATYTLEKQSAKSKNYSKYYQRNTI